MSLEIPGGPPCRSPVRPWRSLEGPLEVPADPWLRNSAAAAAMSHEHASAPGQEVMGIAFGDCGPSGWSQRGAEGEHVPRDLTHAAEHHRWVRVPEGPDLSERWSGRAPN